MAEYVGRPSDEDMRAYLDGEHGPPSAEALAIIQDELERAITVPLNVGACDRCGNTTGPTHVVTRHDGERPTLCRDPFACWERESTRVTPPGGEHPMIHVPPALGSRRARLALWLRRWRRG